MDAEIIYTMHVDGYMIFRYTNAGSLAGNQFYFLEYNRGDGLWCGTGGGVWDMHKIKEKGDEIIISEDEAKIWMLK
jgi:hypothetical protein